MKTTLHAAVELWEVDVFAELLAWEPRPELQRLCAVVRDRGALGQAEFDAVLPGLSPTAQGNLLRHLRYLDLVDERGALTATGRSCVEKGEAPAPELGVYRFLVAVHPLFRRCVLAFQRLAGDPQDRDFQGLGGLPEWFAADPRQSWVSVFKRDEKFTIAGLPAAPGAEPRCRVNELPPASLTWTLDLATGRNEWTIAGHVQDGDERRHFQAPARSESAESVTSVFATWDDRFDEGTRRVGIAYDGNGASGHDTFLRDFSYPSVRFFAQDRLCAFQNVRVEGVPVGPLRAAEARTWALALHLARVAEADAYVTRATWDSAWSAVVRGTPLEPGAGAAPDPRASGASARPRLRWLAAAASDLAME